jgi:para-nitrobenzyl esterase
MSRSLKPTLGLLVERKRSMRKTRLAAVCAAFTLAGIGAVAETGVAAATTGGRGAPIVETDNGAVRGSAAAGGFVFRGLPYAAPPTGSLRWRAPEPAHGWTASVTRPASRRVAPSKVACSRPPE